MVGPHLKILYASRAAMEVALSKLVSSDTLGRDWLVAGRGVHSVSMRLWTAGRPKNARYSTDRSSRTSFSPSYLS